jgi:uncharacterized protein (TIGR03435 family)
MRRSTLAALALFASSALLIAQAPAPAAFEVASVKVAAKQSRGAPRPVAEVSLPPLRVLPGGRVESYGHTLRNLIAVAYDVNTLLQKIEGKQDVLETEFDISGKATAPSLTSAEAKAMVRTLLEERFQLRWRQQPRDVDGYLLMPAREDGRPGPGLRSFIGDCEERANNEVVRLESPDYEQKARCSWTGIYGRQRAVGVSTSAIAERLTGLMGTPVSDRTGWRGRFNFDVVAVTDTMPGMQTLIRRMRGVEAQGPGPDAPQLLDVFRTELGLKLIKNRATVNDFIVERAEPLIEN